MWDTNKSLKYLEEAVEEIESYLLSEDVIRAQSGRQSLSIGLIAFERRWLTPSLKGEDMDRLQAAEGKIDEVANKWRVAWERKAIAELRSRLNLWRGFLSDLEGRPGLGSSFPQEVRNRAIAVDLQDMVGYQPEIKSLNASLEAIDTRFRIRFQSGPFIWQPVPESAFPSEEFWFLYGRPRSRN